MTGAVDAAENGDGRCLSVVVPSFNERGNITPLVRGLEETLRGVDCEILYVDDSTDGTDKVLRQVARTSRVPVRVLHRDQPSGGLAGAVRDGLREATGSYAVVMDADLQHPPALVASLLHTARDEDADLVVASRYCRGGDASGLGPPWRHGVSTISTLLARACFPRRVGKVCHDPMTGFFCLRRDAVDPDRLHPRGFKILFEILARHDLRVVEIPFSFGTRHSGQSKTSWRNGAAFVYQLLALRLGRMSRFAVVGGLGTLVNLAVMWLCLQVPGVNYVAAAVVAAEVSILHNFLLQERFVFRDMREGRHGYAMRMAHFFAFNNIEALLRMPLLVLLVSGLGLFSVLAQALTLGLAFVARFFWTSQVIYRPKRSRPALAPAETPAQTPAETPAEAAQDVEPG